MPDADPADLIAALRRAGLAEVDVSTRRRAEYSGDASLYRVVPTAVAFPRSVDEVIAAVEVCRSAGVPVTARGAGTSIAGNAVGTGLVLDFSRHLSRIRGIDADRATAEVDPGVVLAALQTAARPHGLRFGPDPSTHSRCTIGGMIGNNACGSRALGYGRTSDNVAALDVITGGGERLKLASGALGGAPGGAPAAGDSSPTLAALREVVTGNLAVIRSELGRFGRQVSGYSLEHLLPERGFDVTRALVGSEGTLAVLLGATVRLVPVPTATALVVLGYADMVAAADAVPALLRHAPVAIEGLDARITDVVAARGGAAALPDLPRGRGWLLVELAGATPGELRSASVSVIADSGALDSRLVTDPGEAAALWRIREDGAGLVARPLEGRRAHAGWEDAAVPPQKLGAYLREFEALLDGHGLTGVPYGHFGDGCVHVRIDFPLDRPDGSGVFRAFLLDAAKLVASHGGSMSGEHGDGRARGELLPFMYSRDALDAFAATKAVFDPDDLLNPGVIVRPRPFDADLRAAAAAPPLRRSLAFAYAEDGGDFSAAVHRCTGVGKCRADNTGTGGVMCPSYLATGDEKDSTRGRARVLQEMVNGGLVGGGWQAPEVREALDLCLSCKGCSTDCPTGVDMATYKAEALHQARDQQRGGRGGAYGGVVGDEGDGEGAEAHQRHRQGQRRATAGPVGVEAHQPRSDRTHQEADGEHRRALQQLGGPVAVREEHLGEVDGEGSVGEPVVDLDQVAGRTAHDRAQPAAEADLRALARQAVQIAFQPAEVMREGLHPRRLLGVSQHRTHDGLLVHVEAEMEN